MADPFGWMQNQEIWDLVYYNGVEWVPLPYPTTAGPYLLTAFHTAPAVAPAWISASTAAFHTLLDAGFHTDTAADGVTRGSLIYGNSTPKWDELVIGSANRVLRSDGTDAAWSQIAADTDIVSGAGNTVLRSGGASVSWGQIVNGDITDGTITAAKIANRARTVTCVLSGTPALDAHGGVIGSVPHVDCANGASEQFWWRAVHLPVDYVAASNINVNIRFSSDAAGNNWAYKTYMVTQISGTTGQVQVDDGGVVTQCNATANRPNDYTWNAGTVTADTTVYVFIITDRAALLDDNTGVVSIWDVWLSYTADS